MDEHPFTGFGSLSILPFEIRDLIYRHVFCDRYFHSPQSQPIGLLEVSKALSHEAMDTLYAHSTFRFEFVPSTTPHPRSRFLFDYLMVMGPDPSPSQAVVNRLDHVEISINMELYFAKVFLSEHGYMDHFYKDLFCKLAASDRVRKTCCIHFHGDTFPSPRQLPFVCDLSRLLAFKKVVLKSASCTNMFDDIGLIDREELQDFLSSAHWMSFASAVEDERKRLQTFMEETLGDGHYYEEEDTQCLEFYPKSKRV